MDFTKYAVAPFMPKGRGPGYDCWGLVCAFYKEQLGIELPSHDTQYVSEKDIHASGLFEKESKQWVKVDQEKPGDVILIRINGWPRHVGIVVEPGIMMHTLYGCQTCIESYINPKWNKRIDGIYRHSTCCQ